MDAHKTVHGQVKLGCQRPDPDRPRVMLSEFMDPALRLPDPSQAIDWDAALLGRGGKFNDFGNKRAGNCTFAAFGHRTQSWCANTGRPCKLTADDAIYAYADLTGYDPVSGANDNGAEPTQVFDYLMKKGMGGHKLRAWAEVDFRNPVEMQLADQWFGGVYFTGGLPNAWKRAKRWDVPPGGPTLDTDREPWSWGGHAWSWGGHRGGYFLAISWGLSIPMTPEAAIAYGDRAYVLAAEDWTDIVKGRGLSPSGFDLDGLLKRLAVVSQWTKQQAV